MSLPPSSIVLLFAPDQVWNRALVLVLALVLDALAGDCAWWRARWPHPRTLAGEAIALFDRRLNRPTRSATTRRVRGAVTAVILAAGALGLGAMVSLIALALPRGEAIEAILLAMTLRLRGPILAASGIAAQLTAGQSAAARDRLWVAFGREPTSGDDHGIARATIEGMARSFAEEAVAPAVWYLIGGLPAVYLWLAFLAADRRVGRGSADAGQFGQAIGRVAAMLAAMPDRLAGLALALGSAFAPGGKPALAVGIWWTQGSAPGLIRPAHAEAALAGGLDLALMGPRRFGPVTLPGPWLGAGRARATAVDIRRALPALLVAMALLVLPPAGLAMVRAMI